MLARILLRNSTDRQAKVGTVRAQRAPVRALAERLGVTAIVEYVEEGMSGAAPLDERDVLRRLLADAAPGELVCAFDLSRLTRSDDWEERYTVLGRLRKAGVRPVTVEDGEIDLHTIGGRITIHVRAEGAADERKRIRSRLDAGKASAAEQGRKPQGATPYGLTYSRERKAWGIDEVRAAVRREAVERVDRGETCGQIAEAFGAAGHPTPRGSRWTARMVWHLVTSPTCKGEWTFSGRTIAVPAVVDAATWQRAQGRLLAAQRRGLRRTSHVYLLDDGGGRCDLCDSPLRIRWGARSGRVSYYVCPTRGCSLPWHRTEATDADVWGRIVVALRDEAVIDRALGRGREAAEDVAAGERDAAGYDARIARLVEVEAGLARQFTRGLLSEDVFARELATIRRTRETLTRSAEDARRDAELARAGAAALDAVRDALARMGDALARADASERRRLVRALRPDVRLVADGQPRISLRLRAPVVGSGIALALRTCSWKEGQSETEHSDGGAVEIRVTA